jgi:hypothetical protein
MPQASILGIFAANALYCALSVLGLGALILAAPSLFEVLTWCGVSYLAWLGVKALRAAMRPGAARLLAPGFSREPLVPRLGRAARSRRALGLGPARRRRNGGRQHARSSLTWNAPLLRPQPGRADYC